jgi:hypothetical protein
MTFMSSITSEKRLLSPFSISFLKWYDVDLHRLRHEIWRRKYETRLRRYETKEQKRKSQFYIPFHTHGDHTSCYNRSRQFSLTWKRLKIDMEHGPSMFNTGRKHSIWLPIIMLHFLHVSWTFSVHPFIFGTNWCLTCTYFLHVISWSKKQHIK